jgi:hypothetical protein
MARFSATLATSGTIDADAAALELRLYATWVFGTKLTANCGTMR